MRLDLKKDIFDKDLARELRRFLEWTGDRMWREKIAKLDGRKPLSTQDIYGRYLASLNPFTSAFRTYFTLENSAKSIWRHAPLEVMRVAAYAYVINRLVRHGSEHLRKKVRGFLSDDSHVRGLLFELDIAIHFFHRGHNVDFMDLEGKAEYDLLVSYEPHELEVECKRKSADAGRKIPRSAVYMLSDILFARLSRIGKRFILKVGCQDRMKADQAIFLRIAKEVEKAVQQDEESLESAGFQIAIEYLPRDLRVKSDEEAISVIRPYVSSHAHFSILSSRDTTVIIKSESMQRDNMLKAIYEELKQGAGQFSKTRPALLACFIEDIDDEAWDALRAESGLGAVAGRLFKNLERSHVQIVAYSSDRTPPIREGGAVQLSAKVLHFENPWSTLRVPKAFIGF